MHVRTAWFWVLFPLLLSRHHLAGCKRSQKDFFEGNHFSFEAANLKWPQFLLWIQSDEENVTQKRYINTGLFHQQQYKMEVTVDATSTRSLI